MFGEIEWNRQLGTVGWDSGDSISIDDENFIYITGIIHGDLDDNENGGGICNLGLSCSDMFLAKYNSIGEKIWTKQWGTDTNDSARYIVNKGEFVSFKEGNKDKFNVQKIKQGDLQDINKSVAIKENLPIDNVSINTENEKVTSNQSPSTISNKSTSNEPSTVVKVEKAVINIPVKEQTTSSSSTSSSSIEDLSGLNNESNFERRTPESFFQGNTSTAKYIGNFPTELSSSNYLVNLSGERVAIPSDTRISMNIDFGKANNQISNGKITVNDIGNGSNKVFTFEGDLNGSSGNLSLYPRGNTSGSTGSARLYGDTATYMKGDVDFKSSDNTEIKSGFNAKKQ